MRKCVGGRSITAYHTYRVIHKSLPDFRPLRYSSRDGHAEGKHFNRGRDTLSFCPTWIISPSVDMLPFVLNIPATVPQRSEIPEGLRNYPVYGAQDTFPINHFYTNRTSLAIRANSMFGIFPRNQTQCLSSFI